MKFAGKQHVMEAFMVRFHPQWLKARELVRSGKIGELKAVQVFFTYDNATRKTFATSPRPAAARCSTSAATASSPAASPSRQNRSAVVSLVDRDPTFGTDRLTSIIADFGEGRQLTFTVSTQLGAHQRVTLGGTKGRIEILIPFNAPPMEATEAHHRRWLQLGGASSKEIVIPPSDQYAEEADAFAKAVLGETELPYGIEDGVKNMQILDAVFKSEKTGNWEKTGL